MQVISPGGEALYNWGSFGTEDGQFSSPTGVFIDDKELVFIADSGNHRICVFNYTGQLVSKWGSKGSGTWEFTLPRGVVVNATRHIFVTDQDNLRVQVFLNNTIPVVHNPNILPASPKTVDDLSIGYEYTDDDGDSQEGAEIRWYKNNTLQSQFNDLQAIPASWTNKTDQWNATIRVWDGREFGTVLWTQTVTINNTKPVVTSVTVVPVIPVAGDVLMVTYSYFDVDGDSDTQSKIRWYRNGVHQSTYDDQLTLPAGVAGAGEEWYVTVEPFDGEEYGNVIASTQVTISAKPIAPEFLLIILVGIAGGVTVIGIVLYRRKYLRKSTGG
ncbi:MAG: hypothetical protein RBG13Loki_4363 [Promethearchaeota archaeon CR_4]|nr:MAG: hypothetical protein RBG13Loki_4363 [Candidatus Lokiarchaeota archaeon CR_4]